MKSFYKRHRAILQILLIIIAWRIYLFLIQTLAFFYPQRSGYLGFIPEANFDGVFYVNISQYWYRGLDQAFFPFYPLLMKGLAFPTAIQPATSGLIISVGSLILLLFALYKLVSLDKLNKYVIWIILFYLSFPTSFFLGAVYTESLFIALVILSFYFIRKNYIWGAVIFAMLATATRIIGIFLVFALLFEIVSQMIEKKKQITVKEIIKNTWPILFVPVGLVSYMGFLWYKYADPLLFVHIQPAFGAGRSGSEIILLPQVIYRYFKIFISVPLHELIFWMALLEVCILFLGILLLFLAYKRGIRKSYIIFSFLALIFPTFSGTLSSLPRYILSSFAIFIFLGAIRNNFLKVAFLFLGLLFQGILAIFFFQGFFVS